MPSITELSVPYATPGEIYTASILLPITGLILVLLRINARVQSHPKASAGWDDWLMLPALLTVIGLGITLSIGVHGKAIGYATPYEGDLSPEDQLNYVNPTISLIGKVQYAFCLLMVLSSGFLKLSITCFYRRLFVTAQKTLFDWATKITLIIVLLWTISMFLGYVFFCGAHPSASWGSVSDEKQYCGAGMQLNDAFVVSDLLTDIMILILPLPVIWNLHMTMGRKLMVIAILGMGAVSVVAAIVRVIVSFEITKGGLNVDVDPNLTVSTILYWTMIEAGLGIIAACLPTLQYLIRKNYLDSMISSIRSVFSLRPIRSQQHESKPMGPYTNIHAGRESASITPMVGMADRSYSLAMDGIDEKVPRGGRIYVTKQLSQHDDLMPSTYAHSGTSGSVSTDIV